MNKLYPNKMFLSCHLFLSRIDVGHYSQDISIALGFNTPNSFIFKKKNKKASAAARGGGTQPLAAC